MWGTAEVRGVSEHNSARVAVLAGFDVYVVVLGWTGGGV